MFHQDNETFNRVIFSSSLIKLKFIFSVLIKLQKSTTFHSPSYKIQK